jgi:hypothetical protein
VGLDVMNGNSKVGSFPTPDGVSKYIPTASVQFTIGLPLINDLSIRLVPTVNVKGFQASLWGVGIKHNIKQWIPVVKDLPFDAAVVLAYSKFNFNYALPANSRVTPDMLVSDGASFIADPNLNDYSTQGIKMTATAQTANIVFSKKLAFVTPYVGFGITNTTYNVTSVGNFPTLGDPVQTGNTYKMQIINKSDLLNISSSEVLPNTTVGLRFQLLWILTVHAQYAFQKYPLASLGVGLTFR